MDDNQIIEYVTLLGEGATSRFEGCHCVDEIESLPQTAGHFYVVNTLPLTQAKKGIVGHWTLLMKGSSIHDNAEAPLVFFDPLGAPPSSMSLIKKIMNENNHVLYNNYPLQSIFADSCGLHICYVITLYIEGLSMQQILSNCYDIKSLSETKNDVIVETFLDGLIKDKKEKW